MVYDPIRVIIVRQIVSWSQSRWKDPLHPPAGRGGLTYAQGPHVTYEKIFVVFLINVFKIFVKIFVHNEIY